jgi:low affinity Fe/Cu permease
MLTVTMPHMPSASRSPAWVRLARRTLRHPADRTEGPERGRFEHLAEYGSFLASSPFFFAVCLLVIVAWIVGLIVGASDRFETAGAGVISALTLVLVALLKNAELRSERAIQHKLDAIASSLLQDKRGGDDRDSARELERAIRVHEEI